MTFRKLFCALALLVAFDAAAMPTNFTSTTLDTSAVAVASGGTEFDSDASPPNDLITSEAITPVGTDSAAASGLVAPGILNTSAQVDGDGSFATNATGTAHFGGTFISGGWFELQVTALVLSPVFGAGFANSDLTLLLVSGGTKFFDGPLDLSNPIDLMFFLPIGAASSLDLTLTSVADISLGAGGASSFANVAFASFVPEPASWLLVALALLLIAGNASYRGRSLR